MEKLWKDKDRLEQKKADETSSSNTLSSTDSVQPGLRYIAGHRYVSQAVK